MQRLNRRWRLLRSRDERGAVNVAVALLIIPLIGFAALALDVAAMWAERQQLQVGADAAALAIAQDCARGSCGSPAATATALTAANFVTGTAQARVLTPSLQSSTGRVTVATSTVSRHVFAPVLGIDSSDVAAQATARWGSPTGGTAVLPLAFSWCSFQKQTDGGLPSSTAVRTINETKVAEKDDEDSCTGPSGNTVPGGFGWVDTDPGSCNATSRVDTRMYSDPGRSASQGCSDEDFRAVRGKTVLLPIFDRHGGQGDNAWYEVYGYAAFHVTGYKFPGHSYNASCAKNCITGYYTRFVDLDDAFDYSPTAPRLGASIVSLTD